MMVVIKLFCFRVDLGWDVLVLVMVMGDVFGLMGDLMGER